MRPGFVIMQIGNSDQDRVYRDVIVPAMRAVDVDPIRVDRHNDGRLLNTEIARFIRQADIVVADLTNERPNCYLEVGFAMGIGKFENLILCARNDHRPDRPGRTARDPKVHFDLGGYDLLYWDPENLDQFRAELERKIRYRIGRLPPPPPTPLPWGEAWLAEHREAARKQLGAATPVHGYAEIVFGPARRLNLGREQLLKAAERSAVHTFGWPLGLVLNRDEFRPRPSADGIVARVSAGEHQDYWTLRSDGCGYIVNSLFEDTRQPSTLFFDSRVFRTTEIFLYCRNMFTAYGLGPDEHVAISVRHVGLQGRVLRSANSSRGPWDTPVHTCDVPETEQTVRVKVGQLEDPLTTLVKEIVVPLFALFDFFEVSDAIYDELVSAYVAGKLV